LYIYLYILVNYIRYLFNPMMVVVIYQNVFEFIHCKLYMLVAYHIVHIRWYFSLLFCWWHPLDYLLKYNVYGYLRCIIDIIRYLWYFGFLTWLLLIAWIGQEGMRRFFSLRFIIIMVNVKWNYYWLEWKSKKKKGYLMFDNIWNR
jgi:hypothetical protein